MVGPDAELAGGAVGRVGGRRGGDADGGDQGGQREQQRQGGACSLAGALQSGGALIGGCYGSLFHQFFHLMGLCRKCCCSLFTGVAVTHLHRLHNYLSGSWKLCNEQVTSVRSHLDIPNKVPTFCFSFMSLQYFLMPYLSCQQLK